MAVTDALWRDTIRSPGDVVKVFCEVDHKSTVRKRDLYWLYTFAMYDCKEPMDLSRWSRMNSLGGSLKKMTLTLRNYFKENSMEVTEGRRNTARRLLSVGVSPWNLSKYPRTEGYWKGLKLKCWAGEIGTSPNDVLLFHYLR